MNTRPKRKMCWNCEGNVQLAEDVCPYCRVSLNPISEEFSQKKHNPYEPPYSISNYISNASIPTSPFALMQQEEQTQQATEQTDEFEEEEEIPEETDTKDDAKTVVTTMASLMAGAVFFLFGLLLLLFSNDHYLVLRWSDHYWYVYFVVAIPLIIFGLINLRQFEKEDHS